MNPILQDTIEEEEEEPPSGHKRVKEEPVQLPPPIEARLQASCHASKAEYSHTASPQERPEAEGIAAGPGTLAGAGLPHDVYFYQDLSSIPPERRATRIHPAPSSSSPGSPVPSLPPRQLRRSGGAPPPRSPTALTGISSRRPLAPSLGESRMPWSPQDEDGTPRRDNAEDGHTPLPMWSSSAPMSPSVLGHGHGTRVARLVGDTHGPEPHVNRTTDESQQWSWGLDVVQHPSRGKALVKDPLRRGCPPLSPPLIIRLVVRDRNGIEVPADHPLLARRLVHLATSLTLMSADGQEERSLFRMAQPPPGGRPSGYALGYEGNHYTRNRIMKTLLGETHRTVKTFRIDEGKGHYFLFPDLVIRPQGQFTLRCRLIDVGGHGMSGGMAAILAAVYTPPFSVMSEWRGLVPTTRLSKAFIDLGERGLSRGGAGAGHGVQGGAYSSDEMDDS